MLDKKDVEPGKPTLGQLLALARATTGMTLRDVEGATDKVVSNAYLSQLEKDKISKPSPNMLHALAKVYNISYENLMTRAGYITTEPTAEPNENSARRQARAATFLIKNITPDEEKSLKQYLEYIRYMKRKKP